MEKNYIIFQSKSSKIGGFLCTVFPFSDNISNEELITKLTNLLKIYLSLEHDVVTGLSNGIGKSLLEKMEEYFKCINCPRIRIEVFGPNKKGLNFYENNDYIIRDMIVSKKI